MSCQIGPIWPVSREIPGAAAASRWGQLCRVWDEVGDKVPTHGVRRPRGSASAAVGQAPDAQQRLRRREADVSARVAAVVPLARPATGKPLGLVLEAELAVLERGQRIRPGPAAPHVELALARPAERSVSQLGVGRPELDPKLRSNRKLRARRSRRARREAEEAGERGEENDRAKRAHAIIIAHLPDRLLALVGAADRAAPCDRASATAYDRARSATAIPS